MPAAHRIAGRHPAAANGGGLPIIRGMTAVRTTVGLTLNVGIYPLLGYRPWGMWILSAGKR